MDVLKMFVNQASLPSLCADAGMYSWVEVVVKTIPNYSPCFFRGLYNEYHGPIPCTGFLGKCPEQAPLYPAGWKENTLGDSPLAAARILPLT